MGQYNPSHVTLSKPYRWRGNTDWEPGHPAYREDIPRSQGPVSRGAKSAEAKAERYRQFVKYRKDGLSVADAGREIRVGSSAARQYERERKAALEAQP